MKRLKLIKPSHKRNFKVSVLWQVKILVDLYTPWKTEDLRIPQNKAPWKQKWWSSPPDLQLLPGTQLGAQYISGEAMLNYCWINKLQECSFQNQRLKVRSTFSKDLNMKYYLFHRLLKYCYASNTTEIIFCFSRTKCTKHRINGPWFRWTSEKLFPS